MINAFITAGLGEGRPISDPIGGSAGTVWMTRGAAVSGGFGVMEELEYTDSRRAISSKLSFVRALPSILQWE